MRGFEELSRLRRSLALRQALLAVLVALALGAVISAALISRDFFRTRENIDDSARRLLNSAQSPATQASYTLDKVLAEQVLDGLFEMKAVSEASVLTEKGELLALRDRRSAQPERLLDRLFGRELEFTQDLIHHDAYLDQKTRVGQLQIIMNGSQAGANFLDRALAEMASGLVRSVLLAVAILLISRWMVTRPLSRIAADLSRSHAVAQVDLPAGHEGDEIGIVVGALNVLLRRVEQQAREREHIVEAIPDAIFYKDGLGRWLIINEAAKRLLGLGSAPWQGKTNVELATEHPEMRKAFAQIAVEDAQTWRNASLTIFQKRWTDENGIHEFEVRKIPAFDEQNRQDSLVVIARDVTESRLVEIDLRIAATAFEAREGMVVTDAVGSVLRVNRAFTEVTGYPSEEVVGQNLRLLQSGRHDKAFYATMWETVQRGGSWQGEVWNRRKNGEIYPEWLSITAVRGPDGGITHYVGTLTDITLRKAAEEEIAHLAFYDHLTQLPNRRLMMDRLGHALIGCERHGRLGALILIDLDNFKVLNDTLGHATGDHLLKEAAARLKSCIRGGDTVARLGGDEFVVILDEIENGAQAALRAKNVAEKIQKELSQPYLLDIGEHGQRSHQCTSSIGIALFGDHPASVDELLKRADTAMYQAKSAGRNTLRFFDPEMQAAVKARATLELELRNAIVHGQFLLHYQAQVDANGRVIGAEALVRWLHPERGIVSPKEFIPLAEDTGLILPLGQWVLENACERLALWARNPLLAELSLAVNVSVRQFSHPRFTDDVMAALNRAGARPGRLKLELTESLLLTNAEDVIAKMKYLKNQGVNFSLDDFGTGYSSLSYLKSLPISQLKIDQSFVRDVLTDPSDAVIARTVVALGQSLGLAVIAEGVETADQKNVLDAAGCLAYQGYYFGRPLPAKEFETYVKNKKEEA